MLNPLKVTIENYDEMRLPNSVSVPDFPPEIKMDSNHNVAFDRVIFIEKDDYRRVMHSSLLDCASLYCHIFIFNFNWSLFTVGLAHFSFTL